MPHKTCDSCGQFLTEEDFPSLCLECDSNKCKVCGERYTPDHEDCENYLECWKCGDYGKWCDIYVEGGEPMCGACEKSPTVQENGEDESDDDDDEEDERKAGECRREGCSNPIASDDMNVCETCQPWYYQLKCKGCYSVHGGRVCGECGVDNKLKVEWVFKNNSREPISVSNEWLEKRAANNWRWN